MIYWQKAIELAFRDVAGVRMRTMILEMATLDIVEGKEEAFEATINKAKPLIAGAPGFRSISVRRCIETPNRYLLLVEWDRLEDHTVGFRQSEPYKEWRRLLHHFFDPFPLVQHYAQPVAVDHA